MDAEYCEMKNKLKYFHNPPSPWGSSGGEGEVGATGNSHGKTFVCLF